MKPHGDLAPAAFLLGTWEGTGRGGYPTVSPFGYRERTRWWHDGRPFLGYEQRTWRSVDGGEVPAHVETGFWRVFADGRVEATIAQTGGVAEVAVGAAAGTRVELASSHVALAPAAKPVAALWRTYVLDGGVLVCTTDMAAMGRDRGPHLASRLVRVGD